MVFLVKRVMALKLRLLLDKLESATFDLALNGKNVSFFIKNRTNFLLKGTKIFQSFYILEKLQPAIKNHLMPYV